MARLTKRTMLDTIRQRLNSQSFAHNNDRAVDVMQAGNAVLRDAGYDPNTDWLSAPDPEKTQKGTVPGTQDVIVPQWAYGTRPRGTSEYQDIVDTLSLNPRRAVPVAPGNRVSRQTWLTSRVVKTDGAEPIPEQAEIKFERRSYTVPTHTAHPYKRRMEPRWARSELDAQLFLRGFDVYRQDNPVTIRVLFACRDPHSAADVSAMFAVPNGRTVRSIARSRQDVYRNQAEQDALSRTLKAEKDAIRRDNTPAIRQHPAVKPGNIGLAGLAYRPHGKWFTRVDIPVGAQV